MTAFSYQALQVRQTEDGPPLVFFAAPAIDIERWAGVPQRRRLGKRTSNGIETVGFQREERANRIREIAEFISNPQNTVQNPLLCAAQSLDSVTFAQGPDAAWGTITIEVDDFDSLSMLQLLRRVRDILLNRVATLSEHSVPDAVLSRLMADARDLHEIDLPADDTESDDGSTDYESDSSQDNEDEEASATASVLLEEETQIVEFFDEIAARIELIERLDDTSVFKDDVLGFSRDALVSMLLPTVLVDGQHRLRGAVESAKQWIDTPEGQQAQISLINEEGLTADEAAKRLASNACRTLPVSLLMNSDPAEHVFQFVVVNQKATPMTKALLGTIVSTSLASDELHPIAQRLNDAGIELEDSRAVAYLTRASESPFKDLVSTGVRGDRPGALQWNVLKKLVEIFRELEGGRLYNLPSVDHAKDWKDRYLAETGLIPSDIVGDDRRNYWSKLDGPWRELFIRFFTFIRDTFGDPDDMRAHNAWGNTSSNLFNMVYLTILSSDFFAYLNQRENPLADWDAVDSALASWVTGVNTAYFNRDWGLKVKKDLPAVRKAWAQTWYQYRLSPGRQPRAENFRP